MIVAVVVIKEVNIMNVLEGKLTARGMKIGIVVARFN